MSEKYIKNLEHQNEELQLQVTKLEEQLEEGHAGDFTPDLSQWIELSKYESLTRDNQDLKLALKNIGSTSDDLLKKNHQLKEENKALQADLTLKFDTETTVKIENLEKIIRDHLQTIADLQVEKRKLEDRLHEIIEGIQKAVGINLTP